ncbi:hypothetical protein [Streptomyces sp. NPDC058252]|uniref:hypothetical protein n=1 Tax=Streptomyces sp. NPDC058252 TaxID=3346405 RepID=UPI0036EFD4ED
MDQRVGAERAAVGGVGHARAGVDDRLAAAVDGHLEAGLRTRLHELFEERVDPRLYVRTRAVAHQGILTPARGRGA